MREKSLSLGAFTPDTSSQLDVFRHDGHTLGVNSAQVRVLEEAHQVRLASFLQYNHITTLPLASCDTTTLSACLASFL